MKNVINKEANYKENGIATECREKDVTVNNL